METENCSRDEAARKLEYMELKFANEVLGGIVGLGFVWYGKRYQTYARNYFALFRKPWMRPIIPFAFFYAGWYGGRQLRQRVLGRWKPIDHERKSGDPDILSKFRAADKPSFTNESQLDIVRKLSQYADLSTNGINKAIEAEAEERLSAGDLYRVKRIGRDENDIHFMFSKIHGLENIKYVEDHILKECAGDPVKLQRAIYEAKIPQITANSYEELMQNQEEQLKKYKETVNNIKLVKSDRAKLLALPFYLNRRQQAPEPKRGQWQYNLFKEMYGVDYHAFDNLQIDEEKKITPWDYENFLPAGYLDHVDQDSPEFKLQIKKMALEAKTTYEQHLENQKEFRELMVDMAHLTEREGRDYIHLLKNNKRLNFLSEQHSGQTEIDLATLSEKENYLKKNQYRLDKLQLEYADKKRLAIDKTKLQEMLLHHDQFREKFDEEVGTYQEWKHNTQFENQILGVWHENAFGPMRRLRDEIGLKDRHDVLKWDKLRDIQAARDKAMQNPDYDHTFNHLMNALFMPIDMTEYEDFLYGDYHTRHRLDGENHRFFSVKNQEHIPFNTADLNWYGESEAPKWGFSNAEDEIRDEIPEEVEDEVDEDMEEPEDWEEPEWTLDGEEDEEMYEDLEWPPKNQYGDEKPFSDYFGKHDTLRNRFTDPEIEGFMKILDVKPYRNWRNTAEYHHSLGVHAYEDDSQKLDPEFHLLAEVEREHLERITTKKHRSGATVRFTLEDKVPIFPDYKF